MRRRYPGRSRRWCAGPALAGLVLAACGPPSPPAVLLVSLDTLRADRLGAYGYTRRGTSPSLDRLARDGIVFERHAASSPWTTPSHMSLLTSLSPAAHGVTSDFGVLGDALRRDAAVARLPARRTTLAEVLAGRGWRTAAFTGGVTMDPSLGFGQGFEQYETRFTKLNPRHGEEVQSWIAASETPFLLFLHTFEVHAPYLRARFAGDVLEPDRARRLEEGLLEVARAPGWKSVGRAARLMREQGVYTREVADALYDGGIWHADRWLGDLFAWMRERGLYDDALIVVTSDHGEQLGERDGEFYDTHGHTLFEELIHVPLIVKLPGQRRAGERVRALTRAIDVMPTLLSAAGVALEDHEMEGRDLLAAGAIASGAGPPAFSEALSQRFEAKSIRDERYKLIVSFGAEAVAASGRSAIPTAGVGRRLYDLLEDPRELRDLLEAPAGEGAAERAAGMERALRAHLDAVRGRAERVVLDSEVQERLRALGYIR